MDVIAMRKCMILNCTSRSWIAFLLGTKTFGPSKLAFLYILTTSHHLLTLAHFCSHHYQVHHRTSGANLKMGTKKETRKSTPQAKSTPKPADPVKPEAAKPPKKPDAKPITQSKSPQHQLAQGKKRPADGGPAAYQPETSELEKKRLQVGEELRKVEQQVRFECLFLFSPSLVCFPHTTLLTIRFYTMQIFDLETKYLEQSSAFGNAVRGYEGFLGGISQANRKMVVKPEERLFSLSSSSSTHHHHAQQLQHY